MTSVIIHTCIWLVLIGCHGTLFCADFKPWLPEMLVFEWRNSLTYQTYPSVAKGSHTRKFSSDDYFINTSLSTSVYEYGLELEANQAFTSCQKGSIDNLSATLRYVILDDIAGDPLSFTAGLSYIQPFYWSLKDISSFHHGRVEGELFVSLGKEKACGEIWIHRWWTVGAVGLADRGSPWLRLNLGYDLRTADNQEWRLFCHTLWGLGNRDISIDHFKGYGAINHRSVNLGFRYTYLIEDLGSLSFEYTNRVYAYNFPAYANIFLIEFRYDFGLL